MSEEYGGLSVQPVQREEVTNDPEVAHNLGLGGCEYLVKYPDRLQLAKAVYALANDGHGHHFAVTGEGSQLAISGMALDCLSKARLRP